MLEKVSPGKINKFRTHKTNYKEQQDVCLGISWSLVQNQNSVRDHAILLKK